MYQPNLIFTKDTNLTYLRKLELVFSCLDIPNKNYYTGRPPYSVSAMVNALVFKNLRGLFNLVDLARELSYYPALTQGTVAKYYFLSFPRKRESRTF